MCARFCAIFSMISAFFCGKLHKTRSTGAGIGCRFGCRFGRINPTGAVDSHPPRFIRVILRIIRVILWIIRVIFGARLRRDCGTLLRGNIGALRRPIDCSQAYRVHHFMSLCGGNWVASWLALWTALRVPGHCRLKPLCGAGLRMAIGFSSTIPMPF